jgi:hypothetical protein
VDNDVGDGFVDDVLEAFAGGVGQTGPAGRPPSRWRTSETPAGIVGSTRCRLAAARRPSCAFPPGTRTSVALPAPRRSPAAQSDMKSGTGEPDHRIGEALVSVEDGRWVVVRAAGSRASW